MYLITEIVAGRKVTIASAPDLDEAELILRQRFPIFYLERDVEHDGMDAIATDFRLFAVDRARAPSPVPSGWESV